MPQYRKKRREMVERLKQFAPNVYTQEAELFDALLKRHLRRSLPKTLKSSVQRTEAKGSSHFWVYWLIGFALIRLLRAIFGGQ